MMMRERAYYYNGRLNEYTVHECVRDLGVVYNRELCG